MSTLAPGNFSRFASFCLTLHQSVFFLTYPEHWLSMALHLGSDWSTFPSLKKERLSIHKIASDSIPAGFHWTPYYKQGVNLKNKNVSYFSRKDELILEEQRIAVEDKQATAKPEVSAENKGEECSFIEENGWVGKAVLGEKPTGENWQLCLFWFLIG